MNAEASVPTVQICRTCGGGAPVDVHFCPQCTRILTLGRHGDYFAFLGVPRKLNLDPVDLEQRFRTMSRQFHPDYYHNASLAERRASLERSSYLNDAYRTLKQPIDRIEYLLSLEGAGRQSARRAGGGQEVPASLLEEVFALNEELEDVRELKESGAPEEEWKSRLEQARKPIDEKQAQHEAELRELSARWDALPDDAAESERRSVIEALRDRMLERNYISNLLAGIEKEMARSL